MGNPRGFIQIERQLPKRRPVEERIRDWREVYQPFPQEQVQLQAARCMDCGVPFCHQGCPLGNLIPEWNDLVYNDRWRDAIDRLHATNNFPEFTGRMCPAPCEPACVLAITSDSEAVTIKQVEVSIIDRAFSEGWVVAEPPRVRTGRKVAIIGSGPAGLAAAQQLNRAGHRVTVFERDDRIGGLLRYGIPEFKMEMSILDRRLALLEEEGIEFRPDSNVGVNIPVEELRDELDALVLTVGATNARDLDIPGRQLGGIHLAMEYLTQQNRRCEGDVVPEEDLITAKDKRVVIIGGGDTGADCLGTAHRQGASSVVQLWLYPEPPKARMSDNPWPEWPNIFRISPAHEEGGGWEYSVLTSEFLGSNGRVKALRGVRVKVMRDELGQRHLTEVPGSEFEIPADLILLAIGYSGAEQTGIVGQLGLKLTERGNIATDRDFMTAQPGVFAAGDATRGASLIVWAIAEGRKAARGVDRYLMGSTDLP